MVIKDTVKLIHEAATGDLEAINDIHMAVRLRGALQKVFDMYSHRDALIIIGNVYGRVSQMELEKLFRLDQSRIARIIQGAQIGKN